MLAWTETRLCKEPSIQVNLHYQCKWESSQSIENIFWFSLNAVTFYRLNFPSLLHLHNSLFNSYTDIICLFIYYNILDSMSKCNLSLRKQGEEQQGVWQQVLCNMSVCKQREEQQEVRQQVLCNMSVHKQGEEQPGVWQYVSVIFMSVNISKRGWNSGRTGKTIILDNDK